jgi:activator of HSP90 ATPase
MCKTLKFKLRFAARPQEIYDLLADSKKRTAATGRQAIISTEVGGAFSADAGTVHGINVDLVPGKRIVQAWRRNDFPEGVYSMAAFVLTPTPNGGTELALTHRGVPKALLDSTEAAWRDDYWAPMKAYLAKASRA